MDLVTLMEQRCSARAYAEEGFISTDEIKSIIAKAQLAPSWKNSQTARFYVANTEEAVQKVKATLPGFNQNSSQNAALVVTTFVKDISGFSNGVADNELSNKWGAYDLGLNNAYFILAAKDAGYDTLIMGLRDAGALRDAFNIPKTEQITAVIAIGHGTQEARAKMRKSVDDICTIL